MNTSDLLKIIPIEEKTRAHLLDIYPDNCSYEDKGKIEELAWQYYGIVEEMVRQEEIQLLMAQGPLPEDYDLIIEPRVKARLEGEMNTKVDAQKIEDIRKSISAITTAHG